MSASDTQKYHPSSIEILSGCTWKLAFGIFLFSCRRSLSIFLLEKFFSHGNSSPVPRSTIQYSEVPPECSEVLSNTKKYHPILRSTIRVLRSTSNTQKYHPILRIFIRVHRSTIKSDIYTWYLLATWNLTFSGIFFYN